eukprot:8837824-Ditylum_brightwellii.AAC.1
MFMPVFTFADMLGKIATSSTLLRSYPADYWLPLVGITASGLRLLLKLRKLQCGITTAIRALY